MSDELQEIQRAYREALQQQLPLLRAERFGSVPLPALIWMALAPAWPLNLATLGFPIYEGGELGTGEAVERLLRRMCDARLIGVRDSGSLLLGPSYGMDKGQRVEALDYVLETLGGEGPDEMREHLWRAGGALDATDEGKRLLGLSQPLARWQPLALRAGSLREMAAYLDAEVDKELSAARGRGQLDSPSARHWIDTAEPFAELFGGVLRVSVQRAKRRLELLRRDGVDVRHLANYLARREQDEIFNQFIRDESDAEWALHYVGDGGAGKTMLVRHIMFELAPQQERPILIARVDFDSLNPHYPSRAPGLLLMDLAEELRLRGSIPDKVFRHFDDKVRSVHSRLRGAYDSGDRATALKIEDEEFGAMVSAFAGVLRGVGERPLFILDTCEELAKLEPDGAPSDNVRATFRALEAIHDAVPSLRVIFAGRRPLASVGPGWSTPSSLPPRPYLRLHEIRGFDEQEAHTFLSDYEKDGGHVRPELFSPIVERSLLTEAGAPLRFKVEGRPAEDPVERYNPYELDLYAAWACSDERLDAQTIISGGISFYVRDRIVGRLSPALRPVLAAFVRLRVFNREDFDHLLDELAPQLASAAEQGEKRQPLFEELIGQEWISLTQGGEDWLIDSGMWRRLSAFYAEEESAAWSNAARPAAELLGRATLSRNLHDLSLMHFEAALYAMAGHPTEAAVWWERVESRLAAEEVWEWTLQLTNFLLSDEGAAAVAAGDRAESPLRPAVLATNCAARVNLSDNDERVRSNWLEVWRKADRHPTSRGAERLKFRATTGLCAHIRWGRETHHPSLINEFAELLDRLPDLSFDPDAETTTALFAAAESLAETVEHLDAEWGSIGDPVFCGKLNAIYMNHFGGMGAEVEGLTPELRAYATMLRARLEKACLQHPTAVTSFHEGLELLDAFDGSDNRRSWLGWRRPDDLRSRILLEFIRGIYPTYLGPDYVLVRVAAPASGRTIDADRLRSALFQLEGHLHPARDISGEAVEDSRATRAVPPDCNAHRDFAPYFAETFTALADDGRFGLALSQCTQESKQAEAESNVYLKKQIDRVLLRIVLRARAYDEKGLQSPDALAESNGLEDLALRCALGALSGQQPSFKREELAGGSAKREVVLRHIAWRSSRLDASALDRSLLDSAGELDHTVAPYELAAQLDAFEAAAIEAKPGQGEWVKAVVRLGRAGQRWARAHLTEPVEAARQFLRISAITSQWLGGDDSLSLHTSSHSRATARREEHSREVYTLLHEKLGKRRCAEIAFEEGTLLAARLPDSAAYLLRIAHLWYSECGDDINCLLSSLSQALVAARSSPVLLLTTLALATSDHMRCQIDGMTVPPFTSVSMVERAERGDVEEAMSRLDEDLNEYPGWRPWFVRWCVCLVREHEYSKQGPRMLALRQWLEKYYSFMAYQNALLSTELERLFRYDGKPDKAAPDPQSEKDAADAGPLRRASKVVGYGLAVVGFAAVFILVNFFLLFFSESALFMLGYKNVTTTAALVIQICMFASLPVGAYVFSKHLSTRVRVEHDKEIADTNRPLLTPALLRLDYYIRAFRLRFGFAGKFQTEPADEGDYEKLDVLPPRLARRLRLLNFWFRLLRLNMEMCVIVDEKNTAAPWEAILEAATRRHGSNKASHLQFRRETMFYTAARLRPMSLPLAVLSLVDEPTNAKMAALGWGASGDAPKQLTAGGDSSTMIHQVKSGGLVSVDERQQQNDVGILHLVGVVREMGQKVRMEIREAGGATDATGAEGVGSPVGLLLWAEDVVRHFPQLRICLVQTPPHGPDDEPRDSGSRYSAGLLRRFGADLFGAGVPAVVTLPPLSTKVAEEVISVLSRALKKATRASLSQSARARLLMSSVREMRGLIMSEGHDDPETAAEMAYDLCLYLNEQFDLLINPKSR